MKSEQQKLQSLDLGQSEVDSPPPQDISSNEQPQPEEEFAFAPSPL